jgi:glycosyltransferase involved in cell wall biosynthesis
MTSMAEKPRVSIILSLYKSEQFLEYWLDSIAQQTIWHEAELIVAANVPSRKEREILESFRSKHPHQLQVDYVPRETLYASWNRCIKKSRSNLLAIANVDDIRVPNSLEIQVRALESDRDAVFCYGPFKKVNRFPSQEGSTTFLQDYDKVEFTRSMILGPFFMWRKSDNAAIRYFDAQFRSGGDFDFAIRLAIHGRGVKANDILGFYYSVGSGLSTGSELQPIECTVIELRYGIYDKIDYDYLPRAMRYNIPYLLHFGRWVPVSRFVPDYDKFIQERCKRWFALGMKNYFARKNRSRWRSRLKRFLEPIHGVIQLTRQRIGL